MSERTHHGLAGPALFALLLMSPIMPETSHSADAITKPVAFSGDELIGSRSQGYVELNGNVVIDHDETTVKADHVKIIYADDGKTVDHINATGHVRLHDPTRRGRAEHAVYIPATRKLTLTGRPTIWEDENTLSGNKIELFRDPDRLRVSKARAVVQGDKLNNVMTQSAKQKAPPDKQPVETP